MKKLAKTILIILFILILAGCGAPETPLTDPAPAEEELQEEVPVVEATEVQEEAPAEEVKEIDSEAIFADRCARCHGADRSGGRGPSLLPERLTKDPTIYQTTITDGSGGMPTFSTKLSSDEISALVEYILSAPQ